MCECKCGLNESVCKKKKKWNHNECLCECKELVEWSFSKDDYMWNLSTGDCECDKAWKIDKYLDIKDFSCKKSLFGKLVLACEHEILNTAEKKKKEII